MQVATLRPSQAPKSPGSRALSLTPNRTPCCQDTAWFPATACNLLHGGPLASWAVVPRQQGLMRHRLSPATA